MSSPSLRGLWNECRATVRGLERWRCCMAFFSSAFLAFGLYHVHSVSGITEGGVLGATLLLDHWFSLSPAVSGFVLMLGAVSGFSSYFNEITSSLSKSVLCLEQIRWMREFLDLPLPAGLWEKIAGLPQKEETYLGKDMTDDGVTLSGGEMQKLMMARALCKNCRLLLLDEPTTALDAISENEMYETYSTLLKNKTALFISHRLASTRFCDTILFLENGKIKERGTHDELLALGGSYAHMLEVQSQYYQETEEHI